MSLADTQDDYAKSAAFFSFLGVIVPSIMLKRSLVEKNIRPGSSWTKFNNYKMRAKKFAAMSRKTPLDIDALSVLNAYCMKNDPDAVDRLKAYGFQSGDLDVMNHLMLINKARFFSHDLDEETDFLLFADEAADADRLEEKAEVGALEKFMPLSRFALERRG